MPRLYDQLMVHAPTPVVALNRAVALAEVQGPTVALGAVDDLDLRRYHLSHSTRGDLLGRLGRFAEVSDSYDTALALCNNSAEQRFLGQRKAAVSAGRTAPAPPEQPPY